MAAQYDLEIYQGSDFSVQFQLKDALGDPLDLSGATVASQIRDYADSLLASFNIVIGGLGFVTLSLPRSTTVDLPANRHKFNVVLRLSGTDEVVLEGAVVVRPQISVIV